MSSEKASRIRSLGSLPRRLGALLTLLVGASAASCGGEFAEPVESRRAGLCASLVLSVSPASPGELGTPVALSATSSCAAGETPEYRFSQRRTGTSSCVTRQGDGATSRQDHGAR